MEADLIAEYGQGKLTYDSESKRKVQFSLTTESDRLRLNFNRFIDKSRLFNIPKSQVIDDFVVIKAKPTRNSMFFELALCELMAETGIRVQWR